MGDEAPSFLTLRTGSRYTILPSRTSIDQGERVEFMVSYLSATSELSELERAAQELFDWARPEIDAGDHRAATVNAILDYDPESRRFRSFVLRFHRDGPTWTLQRLATGPAPPGPRQESLLDGFNGVTRDPSAEAAAVELVRAFLEATDAGDLDSAWGLMTSRLRATVPRDQVPRLFAARGRVRSRRELWRLATGGRSDPPSPRLVAVRHELRGARAWIETVTAELEQGAWRVAGWHVEPSQAHPALRR